MAWWRLGLARRWLGLARRMGMGLGLASRVVGLGSWLGLGFRLGLESRLGLGPRLGLGVALNRTRDGVSTKWLIS
jgi:hypothetical protein